MTGIIVEEPGCLVTEFEQSRDTARLEQEGTVPSHSIVAGSK